MTTTISALDANWAGRPQSIAAALIESDGHRALIDPGPGSTLENIRAGLSRRGLSANDLDAVLLTHIHMDHAGASGSLVRENPRLRVYVHSVGAPHMIDPAKLMASARRLWPDTLDTLFGDMLPVPRENLRVLEGGETLQLGSARLAVLYTPGHASHHVTYFDDSNGIAFTGDTVGVRIENGPYILPAAPPPDIDLGIWDESFRKILELRPARLFLTHYGFSENPAEHISVFRERLHRWFLEVVEILGRASDTQALEQFLTFARGEMLCSLPEAEVDHYSFTAGLDLSFLGLARHVRKRAEAAQNAP
jgi:glyoxylase-like metal-dependent hydrolase (beta-lactamase superfamily II)